MKLYEDEEDGIHNAEADKAIEILGRLIRKALPGTKPIDSSAPHKKLEEGRGEKVGPTSTYPCKVWQGRHCRVDYGA